MSNPTFTDRESLQNVIDSLVAENSVRRDAVSPVTTPQHTGYKPAQLRPEQHGLAINLAVDEALGKSGKRKPPEIRPDTPFWANNNPPKLRPNTVYNLSPEELSRLAFLESSGNGYTAFNEGSKAYGKYQFIPDTAAALSERLGLKGDEWKTPENQEKLMQLHTTDNMLGLQRKGLPTDLFHIYGAHQQGLTGFSNILAGKLTPFLEKKMRGNLPKEYRNLSGIPLRDAWVSYWQGRTTL